MEGILKHLQEHGQSVSLNWGEDTGLWEFSWITANGTRFTGFSEEAMRAIGKACHEAVKWYRQASPALPLPEILLNAARGR